MRNELSFAPDSPGVGEFFLPHLETRISPNDPGNDGKSRFTFVIAAGTKDRHNTILEPRGVDFSAFLSNPVVLLNHDHNVVVGRAVGMELKGSSLIGQMEFDEDDDDAVKVKRKIENGFMNAVSPGFIVRSAEFDEDEEAFRITESELVEFSIVSVPSIREAVAQRHRLMSDFIEEMRSELRSLRTEITESQSRAIEGAAPETPAVEDAQGTLDIDETGAIQEDAVALNDDEGVERAIHDEQPLVVESSLEEDRSAPAEISQPQKRKATEEDYFRIIKLMEPKIRKQVRRSLGKE